MSAPLSELADRVGIDTSWRDVHGRNHEVRPETIRAALGALGFSAATGSEIADSLERVREMAAAVAPLVTCTVGQPVALHVEGPWKLALEDGGTIEGRDSVPPINVPGYHRLDTDAGQSILAVAPTRCMPLPGSRLWGLAVQLYSLRRPGDGGVGDFGALRELVGPAARAGADAVAISPVHAQFSADPDRFSPYSPSSRIMLNILHAETDEPHAALEASPLVEWPSAARARLAHFRKRFEAGADADAFAAFRREMGEPLEAHARFEALHAQMFGADRGMWHWRDWPEAYRHPSNPEVQKFALANSAEVAFHAYMQFLADRGLGAAQAAARAAGMKIGLISDLAVGTDSGGSHSWSRQDETLIGLTVGAPPDLLSPQGQDWGLAAFSPTGLRRHGYGAFIEMLRAALRHAGGVRIDHVMGLQRLWVRPEGAAAGEGAYLRFPVDDMLRLVALESNRHKAVVLGEDLGTVPEGFSERISAMGLMGLRVLWFERDLHHFKPPSEWTPGAVAMTSTHDLSTVAGWWSGRDLDWRTQLNLLGDEQARWFEHENRARDRSRLWDAMRATGAAQGDAPPPGAPARVVDAACVQVGRSACDLVLVPIEDVLGRTEQPNLPGTLDEHPNWRRRLDASAAELLESPEVAARLAALAEARRHP